MRIAYTCQMTCVRGGLERIIVEKANALAAAGHDVCIITNNPPEQESVYPINPKVRLFDMSMNTPESLWKRLLYKVRQNRLIRNALRQFKPDITIVVPTWIVLSMLFGPGNIVLESHSSRRKMFSDERQSFYKRIKTAIAERLAACVVTLTRPEAKDWKGAQRVEVIPNFSDIRSESPLNGDRTEAAMAIGRLSAVKQFDLLIDAWRRVADRHPEVRLDIYGEGPLKQSLNNQIEKLGLKNNVVLRGDSAEPAKEYSRHGFLLMSSDYEGFGLVLVEAMRCGCPCISTDCPHGPEEIIRNGETGILVPYKGLDREAVVNGIADAACEMIENAEMRKRMSTEALADSQRFNKERIINRWELLFKELAPC